MVYAIVVYTWRDTGHKALMPGHPITRSMLFMSTILLDTVGHIYLGSPATFYKGDPRP